MKVRRFASAGDFLRRAQPRLLEAEAENNLVLGVAGRFARAGADIDPANYWATVEHDGAVCGCAFRTPPFPLSLTLMPPEALPPLIEDVGRMYASLPGVSGPTDTAAAFARSWSARSGTKWSPRMRTMIHRLTKVRFPDGAPAGTLRRALDEDRPLIRRWAQGFVEDAATTEAPDSFADRVVAAGQMFVWDDGDPRCMVAAARSTPNGTCINAVYTPPRFRRRGYATVAVATLSRQLLDAGSAFCCLYTDLANPTSNSIYRRIGYEPIREGVDISFEVTDAVD